MFTTRNQGLLAAFFGILCAFVPVISFAATAIPVVAPSSNFSNLCQSTGLCFTSGGGVGIVYNFLDGTVVSAIRIVFIGISFLYVSWYALTILVMGYDESTQTEQRKAFRDAAAGIAVVSIAGFIVSSFAPSNVGNNLVNAAPVQSAALNIIDYIMMITGAFLVFIISFSGMRIIVLQGNESEIDKQKKNFFHGLMGVVLLLTARVITDAIMPGSNSGILNSEIGGIIKFLLEIFAGLTVVSFIVSGVFFLISAGNDTLRQRAKRIAFSTVIILIIVIFSYTIVETFVPASVPATPQP